MSSKGLSLESLHWSSEGWSLSLSFYISSQRAGGVLSLYSGLQKELAVSRVLTVLESLQWSSEWGGHWVFTVVFKYGRSFESLQWSSEWNGLWVFTVVFIYGGGGLLSLYNGLQSGMVSGSLQWSLRKSL